VTISGTGFEPGVIVRLGAPGTLGPAATDVTLIDSTVLTATAPAHAPGPVDVVLTNEDGESRGLLGKFAYEDLAVIAVAPTIGSTGGWGVIVITGSGFQSGSVFTVGGVISTVLSDTGDHSSQRVIAPPHAEGPVDVVVTDPNGGVGRLNAGYTYTPPGSMEVNGDWEGDVEGSVARTIRFSVRNNTVVSVVCGTSGTLALDPPVVLSDGTFSFVGADGSTLTGEFFSPIEAFGRIDISACSKTIWYAAKR